MENKTIHGFEDVIKKWDDEGIEYNLNSENYNKILDKGKIVSIDYPLVNAPEKGDWRFSNTNEEKQFLTKNQVEDLAASLMFTRASKVRQVSLQVTGLCNYKCPMCPFHGDGYSEFYKENPDLKASMDINEAKKIVDKLAEAKIERIHLTSMGELFIYPHWEELCRYIKSKGLEVSVTSNGSKITPKVVAALKDMKFDFITYSIDTIDKETYKIVRSDREDDYNNALMAPILTHEAGIYTQVHVTVQKENEEEVKDTMKFYKKHGVNKVSMAYQYTYEETGNMNLYNKKTDVYLHGLCPAFGEFIILVDGYVVGCCQMFYFYRKIKDKLLSIHDSSIEDIINNLKKVYLEKEETFYNYCKNCSTYYLFGEKTSQYIEDKYYVSRTQTEERHYVIPESLRDLNDDILLYLYQNNVVSGLKNNKLV